MLDSLAARGVMTRGVLATTLARRPLASGPRHGHVLQLRQGRQPRRDGARDGVRGHLEIPDTQTNKPQPRIRSLEPVSTRQPPHGIKHVTTCIVHRIEAWPSRTQGLSGATDWSAAVQ